MSARQSLALIALLGLLALAGCGEANMTEQDRADTWDKNAFFGKSMTMRQPAETPRAAGASATVTITVSPVAPVATAQTNLSTHQDTPLPIIEDRKATVKGMR